MILIGYQAGKDGQSYDTYNNVIYYWDDCVSANSDRIYKFELSTLLININEDPCVTIDTNEGLLYVIGGKINMGKLNIILVLIHYSNVIVTTFIWKSKKSNKRKDNLPSNGRTKISSKFMNLPKDN